MVKLGLVVVSSVFPWPETLYSSSLVLLGLLVLAFDLVGELTLCAREFRMHMAI